MGKYQTLVKNKFQNEHRLCFVKREKKKKRLIKTNTGFLLFVPVAAQCISGSTSETKGSVASVGRTLWGL